MQANWSLILNVLLLVGVIVAIGRLMKARRRNLNLESFQVAATPTEKTHFETQSYNDDIIAVRKVDTAVILGLDDALDCASPVVRKVHSNTSSPRLVPQEDYSSESRLDTRAEVVAEPTMDAASTKEAASIMMFIVAKEKRQFAGYELLQTVLAAGLRFGEGHLFYRHQYPNGQGPILCGLAAATPTGVFDLQNIGVFSVRGLCLFMHASNNAYIDAERFAIMLETAKQLRDGLDAILLDDKRQPFTAETINQYRKMLQIDEVELTEEIA